MQMLSKILSQDIYNSISKLNFNQLNEIRMRVGQPVIVYIGGQPYYLCEKGLTGDESKAFVCTKQQIEDVIFNASGNSIYSVNEQLKKGFLIIDGGIRIGLCGNVVSENGNIITQNNWTSLNIRIPHLVKNCSLPAFDILVKDGSIKNTLIVSPPGCGKTTFLRDFILQLSLHEMCINTLVLDERGEICGMGQMELGKFADVLSFSDKYNGFMQGIRAMSPQLIVTDELGDRKDIDALKYAFNCGVGVIATVHASNFENLKQKIGFDELLKQKYFSRYVFLSSRQGPGTLEGIYNENLSRISSY